jgi:two-component system LytT family response regulator
MFVRVHRSHLVNAARVRELRPWFGGDYVVVLADGTKIVTGRTHRAEVREAFVPR